MFNRSHYEDVLVVRVKGLVPEAVWSKRYRHINEFERMLVDEGTTIVKCFLNVSKEEQAERLQERLDDPEKRWKFRAGDLGDRKLWPKYQQAYDDVITQDLDRVRALVRRAGRPQLGPQPRRRQDPAEGLAGARTRSSPTRSPASRTSSRRRELSGDIAAASD